MCRKIYPLYKLDFRFQLNLVTFRCKNECYGQNNAIYPKIAKKKKKNSRANLLADMTKNKNKKNTLTTISGAV